MVKWKTQPDRTLKIHLIISPIRKIKNEREFSQTSSAHDQTYCY